MTRAALWIATVMFRQVVLGLLAAGLCPWAAAQQRVPLERSPSDPARVREVLARLRSDRPIDLAWGGFLAAESRVHEAVPSMRRALARLATFGKRSWPHEVAALALLDGLVRTEARVPVAEIEPFLRGWTVTTALLLLSRQDRSRTGPALLRLFRQHDAGRRGDGVWCATGNLLVRDPVPGFAAALLAGLELELEVHVVDPGGRWVGRSSGRTGVRCGGPAPPEGFPPVVTYLLRGERAGGAVLLAPGRRPVWASRLVVRRARGWPCRGLFEGDRQERRLEWLADLLGVREAPLAATTVRKVRWRGAEDLRRDVVRWRGGIARRWNDVRDALARRGLLDGREVRDLRPRIVVRVHDDREDPPMLLPRVPGERRRRSW